jgi:polyisoprenyl-teichoic acid--peptidoglycan teichoic acid transferase
MRPTEIHPLDDSPSPGRPVSDRLTQLLIWVAFFLVAGVAALAADLWLTPATQGPVAEAVAYAPTATALVEETPVPAVLTAAEPLSATAVLSPTAVPVPAGPVTPAPCVPPDDWGIHVVQAGNTLFSLARRYGTDVESLMLVNCLNTNTIFIGQHLYVPGIGAAALPVATSMPQSALPAGEAALPNPVQPALATAAPTPQRTPTPRPAMALQIPDHYINIVLLGSDRRPGSGAWRTDSMIIVSVDPQANVVRLLSIPRDLWVYIPCHGYNRVNTADLWGELDKTGGGPERVKRTIHHNLGIPIHYYVRVDFAGFISIIDAVGGIDVDVECPLPDISLSAGMHHMSGRDALRYARSRKSTNDFDRGRRQRKVLMALWDQSLTLDIIPRLPELWRAMSTTFQTDMTLDQVINMAYLGVQLKPQRILSRAIGPSQVRSWVTPEGAAVLLPREVEIRTMLQNFYAPLDTSHLDDSSKVRVRVVNGSQRKQAEALAASALSWEGYKVVSRGEADRRDHGQTVIQVYNGDLAVAANIARTLGTPTTAVQDMSGAEQPDPSKPVDIVVILGANYNPCR